ncbi:FAD-binding molybdopterin dehydrogenase [Acidocella aquatica]|uniref:FAD-binding molybdopterin dehydrogenase n=1 Tax=Acidocella aquatica TaxID=1922313 RepID=A0ABQ6AC30_9PROT|nr:FAD binding domain-containing protein [Acidocella aquatica]GLR69000.1 FAD-binding molybdopterin dehydrogenase [Acidocella aquatica]
MRNFTWGQAQTVMDAAAAASVTVADAMLSPPNTNGQAGASIVKAGGIDLLDLLKEKLLTADRITSLKELPGLDVITRTEDGGLRIGAAVTLANLARSPLVLRHYPALANATAHAASPQIRNVATLGGNLLQRPRCWYFRAAEYRCLRKGGGHCFAIHGENQYHAIFDNQLCAIVHPSTAATVLVALGAIVECADAMGAARRVRLEDFLVPPDEDVHRENSLRAQEILTAIELPALNPGTRMVHLKQGETDSFDWPLADVAIVFDLDAERRCKRAAVILGAAAPVPHRAKAAEAILLGRIIDEEAAKDAAHAALADATPLHKNGYKLPLFETLIRRAILRAAADLHA